MLLVLTITRFRLIGLYEADTGGVQAVGRRAGRRTGAFVLHGGPALLVEDGEQHTVLPLFRRGTVRRSVEEDRWEQFTAGQRRPYQRCSRGDGRRRHLRKGLGP
ncbi:hypothetical protein [Streptomyces sp. NPDC088757]|uniref:hypothetical protein n=1 Tax=Streptomyces sp. NPDC088757 TaxID=3365889 RepID=UPI0037FD0A7A